MPKPLLSVAVSHLSPSGRAAPAVQHLVRPVTAHQNLACKHPQRFAALTARIRFITFREEVFDTDLKSLKQHRSGRVTRKEQTVFAIRRASER